MTGAVTASPMSDGRIALWVIGEDGRTYHSIWEKSKPPAWKSVGDKIVPGSLSAFGLEGGGTGLIGLSSSWEVLHRRWSNTGKPEGEWTVVAKALEGDFSAGRVDSDIVVATVIDPEENVHALVWRNYPSPLERGRWELVGTIESLLNSRFSVRKDVERDRTEKSDAK